MFNIFSKSKKPAKGKKDGKKAAPKKKRPLKAVAPTDEPELTPDQSMRQAAERLDRARERLETGEAQKASSGGQDRQRLIEQAMAVHQTQSKLLDDLDEDTKTRLKALAIEKMILNKRKGS